MSRRQKNAKVGKGFFEVLIVGVEDEEIISSIVGVDDRVLDQIGESIFLVGSKGDLRGVELVGSGGRGAVVGNNS